ncbi:hypothetical protein NSK_003841 [Nannochloropsis salina CCMP1776]|uniref:Bromo domain-containing protein n=1 Tax=Nannochloropsis salina CCMP1776 TaxID=1027361 RepID=A0A4D9D885_9STRA|nr:hypothetical protein NSK_003841 [Nannochloropsis salina CCMP1776]|eukprot:TFJ84809.1 hypothetical protein NSK_003841 [Nannochloropsis salina CCMP1776]
MDHSTSEACLKILGRLRKSHRTFAASKDTLVGLTAYVDRVENPWDLAMVDKALKHGEIVSPSALVQLLRRPASNCLRFCIEKGNAPYREKARHLLVQVDSELRGHPWLGVAPLPASTYTCLDLLEQLVIPHQELRMFWARVENLVHASLRAEYAASVDLPMDMGRLTSELLEEGISAAEFLAKAEVVFGNCIQFWSAHNDSESVAVGERGKALLESLATKLLPDAWQARCLPPLSRSSPPPGRLAFFPAQGRVARPLNGTKVSSTTPPTLDSVAAVSRLGEKGEGGARETKLLLKAPGAGGLPRLKAVGPAKAHVLESKEAASTGAPRLFSLVSEPGVEATPLPCPSLEGPVGSHSTPTPAPGGPPRLKVLAGSTGGAASSSGALEPPPLVLLPPGDGVGVEGNASMSAVPVLSLAGGASVGAGEGVSLPSPKLSVAVRPSEGSEGTSVKLSLRTDRGGNVPLKQPTLGVFNKAGATAVAGIKRRLEGGPGEGRGPETEGAALTEAVKKKRVEGTSPGPALPSSGPIRLKIAPPPPLLPVVPQLGISRPAGTSASTLAAESSTRGGQVVPGGRAEKTKRREGVKAEFVAGGGEGGSTGGVGRKGGKKRKGLGSPGGKGGGETKGEGPAWESDCTRFLDKVMRLVQALGQLSEKAGRKATSSRYSFDKPVVVMFPQVAAAYLARIAKPMDTSTLRLQLKAHQYGSPKEFLLDMDLIFANAIAFNDGAATPYEQEVVLVSSYLRRHLDRLALECLPLEEEYKPGERLNLSEQRREENRQQMEEKALRQLATMAGGDVYGRFAYQEMRELIQQLKKERRVGEFFWEEVNRNENQGYYRVIARPICFRDILKSMDTETGMRVGQVVADIRLIYQNALQFNSGTETLVPISRVICEAARLLQRKLEEKLPLVYLRIAENVERQSELREKLKVLRAEDERQRRAELAALTTDQNAAGLAGGEALGPKGGLAGKGAGAISPAAAGGPSLPFPSPGVDAPSPRFRGDMEQAAGHAQGGRAGGNAAVGDLPQTGSLLANKLRKEKRREAELDRKHEERRRKERESKLKERITQEAWARAQKAREKMFAAKEQSSASKQKGEEGEGGREGAMGGQQDTQNMSLGRDVSATADVRVEDTGGGTAFQPVDLSRLGTKPGRRHSERVERQRVRSLLAELFPTVGHDEEAKSTSLGKELDTATGDDKQNAGGTITEDLFAQLNRVPAPEAAIRGDIDTSEKGEEERAEDEESLSVCSSLRDAGDDALWEDTDERARLRRLRLLLRVVRAPDILGGSEVGDHSEEGAGGPWAPSLVHVTVIADVEDRVLGEEDRGAHGGAKRRSRRVKLQSQRPVGLEINGGERRVFLQGERQKVRAGSFEAAVALRLGGQVEVQLIVPLAPRSDVSSTSISVPNTPALGNIRSRECPVLTPMFQEAKEWCKGSQRADLDMPSASRWTWGRRGCQPGTAADFYHWLAGLNLAIWEEGDVAFSPSIREEEREGGNVYVAQLVFPVGKGALYVGGHQVHHTALLQKHKAEVVVGE